MTSDAFPTPDEIARVLAEALADPNVVHLHMLRGSIAQPSLRAIIHIYGADALRAELATYPESPPAADAQALLELQAAVWMVGNLDTPDDRAAWWRTFQATWEKCATKEVQDKADEMALRANAPFVHVAAAPCEHDFKGWREFEDGRGGETVCTKCGMGAMEHTLRNDPT